MENKDDFLYALAKNDGQLDEIVLGETLHMDEAETSMIISQLLLEYKIIHVPNRCCSYSVSKKTKRNIR